MIIDAVGDKVQATNFFGFVLVDPKNDKIRQLVTGATTHFAKPFRVCEERADSDD